MTRLCVRIRSAMRPEAATRTTRSDRASEYPWCECATNLTVHVQHVIARAMRFSCHACTGGTRAGAASRGSADAIVQVTHALAPAPAASKVVGGWSRQPCTVQTCRPATGDRGGMPSVVLAESYFTERSERPSTLGRSMLGASAPRCSVLGARVLGARHSALECVLKFMKVTYVFM